MKFVVAHQTNKDQIHETEICISSSCWGEMRPSYSRKLEPVNIDNPG